MQISSKVGQSNVQFNTAWIPKALAMLAEQALWEMQVLQG
jgi:hypothetical protein